MSPSRSASSACLGGATLVLLLLPWQASAAPPSVSQLRAAADCADCTAPTIVRLNLPESGVEAYSAKLLRNGRPAKKVTILADGKVVDDVELVASEARAYEKKYGRMSRRLRSAIDALPGHSAVSVTVYVRATLDYPDRQALGSSPARLAAHQAESERRIEASSAPVIEKILRLGGAVVDGRTKSPLIRATMPASAVAELAAHPNSLAMDLDSIGSPQTSWMGVPQADSWYETGRFPAARQLSTAPMEKVCAWEFYRPTTEQAMYLRIAEFANPMGTQALHMGETASILSNTDTVNYMGITDSPYVYAANHASFTPTPADPNALKWCINRGTRVVVNTMGLDAVVDPGYFSGHSMYVDWVALNYPYPVIIHAGGNDVNLPVTNRSFNALAVGGSETQNDSNIANDTIWPTMMSSGYGSSWKNPASAHGDRELPNLVAPSVGVGATQEVGAGSGTSVAAPQVAGVAMLMHARDPSTFSNYPEMTRAAIMATAIHNVDGQPFSALPTPGPPYPLDAKDGVGALQAHWAVDLAAPANHRYPGTTAASKGRHGMYVTQANFDVYNEGPSWNVIATSTGRLRAVIAWNATPGNCNDATLVCGSGSVLDADLDLTLLDSSQQVIAMSTSYDSAWEGIDHPVTAGQTYFLRIRKYGGFVSPGTYVGIAWYNYVAGTE